jgi:hypothetical protein
MRLHFLLRLAMPGVIAAHAAFGVSVARCNDEPAPVVRTESEFRKLYLPRLDLLEQEHASFEAVADKELKFDAWPVPRYQRLTVYADSARRSYQARYVELEPPKGSAAAPSRFPKPGDRKVISASTKGQFRLRGDAGVDEYQIVGVGERDRAVIDAVAHESKAIVLCAFYLSGYSMRELLEKPNFRIRSIASDAKSGHVHVTFEDDSPDEAWRELHLEFAPELAWRIVACKTVHSIPNNDSNYNDYERMEVDEKCDYQPRGNTFIPSEITTRWTRYPRDRAQPALTFGESRVRIVKFEPKEISEEQFLLSTFGLPDSVLVEDGGAAPRNPWSRYWLISLGVLGALLLLYVWARRGTRKV